MSTPGTAIRVFAAAEAPAGPWPLLDLLHPRHLRRLLLDAMGPAPRMQDKAYPWLRQIEPPEAGEEFYDWQGGAPA